MLNRVNRQIPLVMFGFPSILPILLFDVNEIGIEDTFLFISRTFEHPLEMKFPTRCIDRV